MSLPRSLSSSRHRLPVDRVSARRRPGESGRHLRADRRRLSRLVRPRSAPGVRRRSPRPARVDGDEVDGVRQQRHRERAHCQGRQRTRRGGEHERRQRLGVRVAPRLGTIISAASRSATTTQAVAITGSSTAIQPARPRAASTSRPRSTRLSPPSTEPDDGRAPGRYPRPGPPGDQAPAGAVGPLRPTATTSGRSR